MKLIITLADPTSQDNQHAALHTLFHHMFHNYKSSGTIIQIGAPGEPPIFQWRITDIKQTP